MANTKTTTLPYTVGGVSASFSRVSNSAAKGEMSKENVG
jgi:hypothetical protein